LNDFHLDYHTYAEHIALINQMVTTYPNISSRVTIGTSIEGREIVAIRIGRNWGSDKPHIIYNAAQHAREWIGPAVLAYFITELCEKYGSVAEITRLVDEVDFSLVTITNPDGYLWTWSNDRLWRKNRRQSGAGCVGVDINRNWEFMWNTGGSSPQPCSDTYHGPSPGSEPENSAIADYVGAGGDRVRGYIDWHAYSQLWMNPWGYSYNLPADDVAQKRLCTAAVAALAVPYRTQYDCGNIANIIYIASGSSTDWVYGVARVKYGYGVELRDTGRYGFILPADQIIPSGIESFEAVKVMADTIIAEFTAERQQALPLTGI